MAESDEPQNKQHKPQIKGKKVLKKSRDVERHNPKAFTYSGGAQSFRRRAQRILDLQTKREKPNLVTPKVPEACPPPLIVVVQGPTGVGKTTLLRSLVAHYMKQTLNRIEGTVTITSGKMRRITFIECPQDIHTMLDLGKIADLVLLVIDASFGFEMQTFEFINALQVHGLPKIMGVLTHLDKLPTSAIIRRTRKQMKKRFWAELYDGAKLFYLSGLQNGLFNKTEIRNLCRFISVQNFPVLSFRNERPYMLVLRHESASPPESGRQTQQVNFYGYLRGATLRPGSLVHIPRVGDFPVKHVDSLTDPCPLPDDPQKKSSKSSKKLRTLKVNERRIYAPLCDVKSIQYDEEAIYIQLPQHKVGFTKKEALEDSASAEKQQKDHEDAQMPEAVRLIRELQNADNVLQQSVDNLALSLTSDAIILSKSVDRQQAIRKIYEEPAENADISDLPLPQNKPFGNELFQISSALPDLAETESASLENMIYNTSSIKQKASQTGKSSQAVYLFEEDQESDSGADAQSTQKNEWSILDESDPSQNHETSMETRVIKPEEICRDSLKTDCFITGGWEGDLSHLEEAAAPTEKVEEDQKKTRPESALNVLQQEVQEQREETRQRLNQEKAHLTEARELIKESSNDAALIAQYVRIVIEDLPAKWYNHICETKKALIIGGLLPGEVDTCRFIQARVKKHKVSLTGTVLEANTQFKIVKKLKLVGEPQKILKNTAFIHKMFNSDLEVTLCVGKPLQYK